MISGPHVGRCSVFSLAFVSSVDAPTASYLCVAWATSSFPIRMERGFRVWLAWVQILHNVADCLGLKLFKPQCLGLENNSNFTEFLAA